MTYSLTEVFGNDPTYMMGIAYEVYTYDEDQNMQVKHKGWQVPFMEAEVSDIDAYATKFQIPARRSGDKRKFWESEEPVKDAMTGDETYYLLYVRNLDETSIDEMDFHNINEKLLDVGEEMLMESSVMAETGLLVAEDMLKSKGWKPAFAYANELRIRDANNRLAGIIGVTLDGNYYLEYRTKVEDQDDGDYVDWTIEHNFKEPIDAVERFLNLVKNKDLHSIYDDQLVLGPDS